jgi:hypothetical protein
VAGAAARKRSMSAASVGEPGGEEADAKAAGARHAPGVELGPAEGDIGPWPSREEPAAARAPVSFAVRTHAPKPSAPTTAMIATMDRAIPAYGGRDRGRRLIVRRGDISPLLCSPDPLKLLHIKFLVEHPRLQIV